MGVDPRPGADELVGPADDPRPVVRPRAQAGQRVGEDREAGRQREAGERRGQLRVVVRARDDEARGGVRPSSAASSATSSSSSDGPPGDGRGERRRDGRRDAPARGRRRDERRIGEQRLPERDVELDRRRRARPRPSRRRDRRASGRGPRSPDRRRTAAARRTTSPPGRRAAPGRSSAARRGRAARAAGPRVSTTSGTRDCSASITAGWNSATAVPDVASRTTGRPLVPGDAEREEARRALVEEHADPEPGRRPQREGERRRARPGADDRVGDAGRDELGGEGAQEPGVAHASSSGIPSAEITACSLIRDSSHSRSGSESATIPQPANSVARVRSTIPHRSATHSSPSPSAPSHPIGPGVPAPVEALVLVDERQGDVARVAADGRRRVEPLPEREQPAPLGHGAGDLRHEVLDEAQRHDAGLRARSSASRRRARAGRGSRRRRSRAPRGPSRRRAGGGRAPRPRRRPRRAGSCPRRRRSGTSGPRCGRGARAWRPGTSARRAGMRTSCSRVRSRRGVAGRSARRARPATGGPTRRASTTLSIRPRPTAPAYIPTSRRHSSWLGCSSLDRAAARTPASPRSRSGSAGAPAPDRPAVPSARRGDGAPSASPSTSDAVTNAPSGVTVSSSSGRTSELAPNGPHASSAAGSRPVNPIAPRSTGPAPGVASAGRSTCARREQRAPGGLGVVERDGACRPRRPTRGRCPRTPSPPTAGARAPPRGRPRRRRRRARWDRATARRPSPRQAGRRCPASPTPGAARPGAPPPRARARSGRRGSRSPPDLRERPALAGQRHLADPRLGHAGGAEERGAQARVRVLEPRRIVREQPARDDLVDRPEPGDRGEPRVERRDRAGRDRVVEVALDQRPRTGRGGRSSRAWNTRPAPIVSRNSRRAIVR